jgi:exopolysaccharide biosynthesis polyprenyl glycosylphosphotransferase
MRRTWELPAPPGSREPHRRARALVQTAAALRRGWAPADAILAAVSMLLAHRLSPVYLGELIVRETLWAAGVYAASFVLVAYAMGLYAPDQGRRSSALWLRCLVSAGFASAITLGFFYLVFYRPIGRWVIAGAVGSTTVLVFLLRDVLSRLLRHQPRRTLLVGKSVLAERIVAALGEEREPLYAIVGTWAPPRPHAMLDESLDELVDVCRDKDVDELVLAGGAADLEALLRAALGCMPLGCRVRTEADFHEDVFEAVPLVGVTPEWMLSRGWDTSNPLADAVKRVSDVVLALLLLVLLAPLALLAMLAVKLTGGGPVIYTQLRVGRYGRPFPILKLRTMRTGAEDGRPRWSDHDDPRRTTVGRWLRRLRIDELPQLVNILRGDMSFVGPRPERPEFVELLEQTLPYYAWRHLLRPGLTGWAQINYPYGASVDDARRKLEYDLYYVRHAALATDLTIVLRTVTAAMRGAR